MGDWRKSDCICAAGHDMQHCHCANIFEYTAQFSRCGSCHERRLNISAIPIDRIHFLLESNAIEGIYAYEGDYAFDDHWKALLYLEDRVYEEEEPVAPRTLHKMLMRHEEDKFPGEYRQCKVWVGGQSTISPLEVRPRMQRLLKKARQAVWAPDPSEDALWSLHLEFETIHPFIDGNGRVGRLWWHGLRARAGFPMQVIHHGDRFDYYREIDEYRRAERLVEAAEEQTRG